MLSSSSNGVGHGPNLEGDFLMAKNGTASLGKSCLRKLLIHCGINVQRDPVVGKISWPRTITYKASLSKAILLDAAYKILQARSNTFNFVDAFAGPWNTADGSSHSDTSFDQAVKTLQGVRNQLESSRGMKLRIRFCFCEKRKAAFEELSRYAQANNDLEIRVFRGKFEENLNDIAAACADGFTFTFIDPTGWKIDSRPILKFLRDRNGEFMLNFMAEHVNRHAGFDSVQASFGQFLASNEWRQDFHRLPDELNNEQKVLCLLRRKIRELYALLETTQGVG